MTVFLFSTGHFHSAIAGIFLPIAALFPGFSLAEVQMVTYKLF
jgi:hypothetical protein